MPETSTTQPGPIADLATRCLQQFQQVLTTLRTSPYPNPTPDEEYLKYQQEHQGVQEPKLTASMVETELDRFDTWTVINGAIVNPDDDFPSLDRRLTANSEKRLRDTILRNLKKLEEELGIVYEIVSGQQPNGLTAIECFEELDDGEVEKETEVTAAILQAFGTVKTCVRCLYQYNGIIKRTPMPK